MTCSRPQRTATWLRIEPGTSGTGVRLSSPAPVRSVFSKALLKGMDSEPHKTPYVYVKYHHKFIPGTREFISGLLRKIFVFKVGKPSFFPASE